MRCRGLGLIVCLIGVCELTGCASGPSRGLFVRNSRTTTNKDRARAAQELTDLNGNDADLAKRDETTRGRVEKDAKVSRSERDQPTKRPLLELPDELPEHAERHPRTPNDDSGPTNNIRGLADGLTSIDHRIDTTEPSGGQFDVSSGGTRDNGFATIEAPAPKRRSGRGTVQNLPTAPRASAVPPAALPIPTQSPLDELGQDTRVDLNELSADDTPSNRLPFNRTSIDAVPTTDRSVVPAEFLSDSATSGVVPAGGVRSTTWTELPAQRPETKVTPSGASTPDPWPRIPAASAATPAFANPATNVPVLTNIPAGAPLAIAPFVTAPELERLITQTTVESAMMTPGETEAEQQVFLRKHVQLRLLHLIAGQMDRALQPVPGIDPADQEFWQQMLWGIANYFDTQGMPDSAERATQTIAQLQVASLRLQEKARLELKNLAFCQKITSFGIYQRFKRDQFTPGQPVLLYAEAANFKSEPSSDGQFRTLMKSTIDIHEGGPQGRILDSIQFKPSEDRCRNHRRDYFHSYEFAIPQGIDPGPHVLRLTVEDQLGRKTASATMNITVE